MTTLATAFNPHHYHSGLGHVQFGPFASALAAWLPGDPGGDVLEIAAGTGLLTVRLRERLHSARHLVATDLNGQMLAFARKQLAQLEGVTFQEASGMALPFEDGQFAAVACGFGFMFMPDRQAALVEARRVLKTSGMLLFSVWDRLEENPHALANAQAVEGLFPGDPEMKFRTPYEMHDHELLGRLLGGAQFKQQRIETRRIPIIAADPRAIATGQILGTPRAALIAGRGIAPEKVVDDVTASLVAAGGDPYHGHTQAVLVKALAI